MDLSASLMTLGALIWVVAPTAGDETHAVNPRLQQPVRLPAHLIQGKKFYVAALSGTAGNSAVRTARTWNSPNPAWLPPGVNFNRELKMEQVLWQRDPVEIVREALVQAFEAAGDLVKDEASADFSLSVTLYRFGLAEATWREYYSKVEMLVRVNNLHTGASTDIAAIGTCVAKKKDRSEKSTAAIQAGLETALGRALTNFLYNAQLKSAVEWGAAL